MFKGKFVGKKIHFRGIEMNEKKQKLKREKKNVG